MEIDTGNTHEVDTQGTGWFIGFGPWTLESVGGFRHVRKDEPVLGLCVKWFHHEPGHSSGDKPVSEGRTVSLLVTEGGEFHLDFSTSPEFAEGCVRTVVLRREGDYAAWGAGLFHRWRCISRSTIATVRWNTAASP